METMNRLPENILQIIFLSPRPFFLSQMAPEMEKYPQKLSSIDSILSSSLRGSVYGYIFILKIFLNILKRVWIKNSLFKSY